MQHSASEQVLSLSLKLLSSSGLWLTEESSLYRLRTIVAFSSNFTFILMCLSYFLVTREMTDTAVENAWIAMTMIPVAFFTIVLTFKRGQFEEIVSSLKSFVQCTTCRLTKDPVDRAVAFERRVALLLAVVLGCAISSNIFEPSVTYFTVHQDANSTYRMELPFKMYPSEENTYVFCGLYLFQVIVSFLSFITIAAEENFMCALILYTTNQFEILAILIRNFDSNKSLLLRLKSDQHLHTNLSQNDKSEYSSGSLYDILTFPNSVKPVSGNTGENAHFWKNIAALHQQALRNANNLCSAFKTIFFLHYVLTSLIICLLLYQLNSVEEIFGRLYLCSCLTALSTRLFILNLLPTRLTTKSLEVADAVSATQWYSYSNEVKSTLVIIMCRAQRPVYLWAGRFAVMSLETYAAMLQAAYSYYSILRSLT